LAITPVFLLFLYFKDSLISGIDKIDAIKNVVLFTTGMNDSGDSNYSGLYTSQTVGSEWQNQSTGIRLYAYANSAMEVAERIKKEATLYTIGLYQELEGMPESGKNVVEFFKLFTKDLASTQESFHDVNKPDELKTVFGDVAEAITEGAFTFSYAGIKGQRTGDCVYDDDFFNHASTKYDHPLAIMSLSLAMAAFGDSTAGYGDEKARNCVALLESMGFKDVTAYGYETPPGENTIAAVFAHKPIECSDGVYELMVTAVRGGEYKKEWAGNFRITDDDNYGQQVHRGFEIAREKVSDEYLSKYIKLIKSIDANLPGKSMKLWTVGYSRGAAVANLFASHVQSNIKSGVFTTTAGD
jgi:hypothetical protein